MVASQLHWALKAYFLEDPVYSDENDETIYYKFDLFFYASVNHHSGYESRVNSKIWKWIL